MLASGGDHRITIPRGGNTNKYGASPFPRAILGYAASTANDISLDAFRHLEALVAGWPADGLLDPGAYGARLEQLRARIRAAWNLDADTEIVFAPSGTDLEYVALALAQARSGRPVANILLGQDEVGSGCVLSAAGRYFAQETAVTAAIPKGDPVAGLYDTQIANLPVRDEAGRPIDSARTVAGIDGLVRAAKARGRHVLAHVVHGSKTGLILPDMAGIDELRAAHGDALSLVVDACQARIESPEIRAYLKRDAIVLLTGSKFIGGPPFSGFALVPRGFRPRSALAPGLATLFRRGEWPGDWRACDPFPATTNPGLLLRLEAALFELERFAAIDAPGRARVISGFGRAVRSLTDRLGVELIGPSLDDQSLPLGTLATIDLAKMAGSPDFAIAQRWHRVLAARGLRLGQPVKCRRNASKEWSGTLRISLSMPLVSALAELSEAALDRRFDRDMAQIADVLEAAQRPIVA